jgi:hypothetical protein
MAYAIQMQVNVVWVPDGAGGMTAPVAQRLSFFPSATSATGLPNTGLSAFVPVPGTDTVANPVTAANINTAISNAVTDIEAQIAVAATLARIQGFAGGTG